VRPRRCARCRRALPLSATRRRRYCGDACRVAAWRRRRPSSVFFSSRSAEWQTPPDLFAELDAEFRFTLDACATPESARCERYFTAADDALVQRWTGRVFCNPPYGGEVELWVLKAYEAAQAGAELVVCLLPARTDARWWRRFATRGEVRFLPRRLSFGGASKPAPFPSAVVVFRNPFRSGDGVTGRATERGRPAA